MKYQLVQHSSTFRLRGLAIGMILALGTPLPANVKPWKYFVVDAVMVSAYYVQTKRSVRKRVYEKGIKEVLDFDGTVILDSGAFQALKRGKSILIDDLIEIYKNVEDADIKLSLDWPDDKIIENFEKMSSLEVFPVVPLGDQVSLDYFEKIGSDWVFIGRLAKKLMHFGRNGFESLDMELARIASITRKNKWALGVGNWKTIQILAQNDIDGTDTSSYRIAAAYGDVIVPGKGTQHVTGRKKDKKRWRMRMVKEEDLREYLDKLNFSLKDLKSSFEKRTIFNAFALTEIKKALSF